MSSTPAIFNPIRAKTMFWAGASAGAKWMEMAFSIF